jgi:hypothetical protein
LRFSVRQQVGWSAPKNGAPRNTRRLERALRCAPRLKSRS